MAPFNEGDRVRIKDTYAITTFHNRGGTIKSIPNDLIAWVEIDHELTNKEYGVELANLEHEEQPTLPGIELPVKGLKHDQEKIRMDLIPAIAIQELSKVLTYGAQKYAAHNWSKGIEHSRLFAASLRHLYAYKAGEELDPETGICHISHALCNLVFLTWMRVHRPDLEDLIEKK